MDQERRDKMLIQVKLWLPNNGQLDEELYTKLLKAALDRTIDSTLNFLNFHCDDVVPRRLESLIVAMCVQMIKSNNLLNVSDDNGGGGVVSSLTEGDTSISFVNPSEAYAAIQTANPVTSNFLAELYNYRKLPR